MPHLAASILPDCRNAILLGVNQGQVVALNPPHHSGPDVDLWHAPEAADAQAFLVPGRPFGAQQLASRQKDCVAVAACSGVQANRHSMQKMQS